MPAMPASIAAMHSFRRERLFLVFAILSTLLMSSAAASAVDVVTSVSVKVQTDNVNMAGTDNDVFLRLVVSINGSVQTIERALDNEVDNFERNQEDNFTFPVNPSFMPCAIKAISIRKSEDDSNGGWKLAWFQIFLNGELFHTANVNQWLEDNHREWGSTDFKPVMCPPPPPPPGIKIEQIPFPPCTIVVEVPTGNTEFPFDMVQKTDKDCDEIPDDKDKDFSPPDPDGDGIPTELEDSNHNGQVDPGETDPAKSDVEKLLDSDGDHLADIFEDVLGTKRDDPDTDGDGWFDGPANVRTQVFLLSVECINRQEDVELGDDEIFIAANHARWPQGDDLSGIWEMDDGESAGQILEIARRTRGIGQGTAFSVRIDLREEDLIDATDDDLFLDRDLAFSENQSFKTEYLDDGFFNTVHYKLHFVAISEWFADPNPTANADADKDGLVESVEHDVGGALAGVADPVQPDIYMELDVAGEDQVPERYSKEDVSSLFTYRGYAFHLDDGVFGGGQVLPDNNTVDFGEAQDIRNSNFDKASRCGIFRYALAVNEYPEKFGMSDKPIKDKAGNTICRSGFILVFESDFLVLDVLTDFESIVWIHELGHTLGLCHPPAPGSSECSSCTLQGGSCACTRPDGSAAGDDCSCTHYAIDESSDTAMGTGVPFPWLPGLINAIDREPMFEEAEWKAVDLTSISSQGPAFGCP